jgi:RNA polymerase sigma-70 factor (ECF subfamily)
VLEAARGGDPAALEALLERHQARVYRFGLKMCGQAEDAQDVVQDTLFAAARTIGRFRGQSSVSTWLYSIARSFCIKKRRRRASAPEVVSLEERGPSARETAAGSPDPERALAKRELGSALDSAISALGPGLREVLLLRDVEGLSAAEVSQVMGLAVPAVKSRLHRARAALRERLAPFLDPTPGPPEAAARGCPDVVALLSRHLEGDVDPETCAAMERHVAGCRRCGAACDSLRRTLKACSSVPAVELPASLKDSLRAEIRAVLTRHRPPKPPRE